MSLATPGAKVMVYYASFLVNIKSKTYRYPDKVRVTYTPIDTSKPDLVPLELQATTPLAIGTPTTFQYKYTNLGKTTNPKGFTIKVTDAATGVTIHATSAGPLDKDVGRSGTFTYTFTAPGTKQFELYIDANNEIDEGAFEGNNKLRATFNVSAGITGDFDIIPSIINFKDPFKLVPKNIATTAGCTYTEHSFKLTRASSTWTAPKQTSKTQELPFSHPGNYPTPPIGLGTVTVSMKIKGTCGETDWIEKTLTVNGTNSPPYFKIGWFMEGDNTSRTPLMQVLQGAKIQARVIQDPTSSPPSPSDPENDSLTFTGWDFNRTDIWVKNLPNVYGFVPGQESLRNITADTVGAHGIYATMTDSAGASYTAYTMVDVIAPNPVPIATCPPLVKENRPVAASLFSASQSYSPAGRQIDHARNEWTNKLPSYTNGTTSDITVQASLHVWDNGSPPLKSLSPSVCSITVQPDLPPIGKLDVPPFGIRHQSIDMYNKSYSPDGDLLVSATYRYKYDAANDGFANDGWIHLPGTMTKAAFTPTKVGKYLLDVTVCEDYGRCGSASSTQANTTLTIDVLNLAPNVEFTISGKNPQPDLNPLNTYSANTVYGWNLYETNSTNMLEKKNYSWSVTNGTLLSGLGKHLEVQYPLSKSQWTGPSSPNYSYSFFSAISDGGFGPNGFTAYKGMTSVDSSRSQPLLLPPVVSNKFVVKTPVDPNASLQPYQWSDSIQTTKSHIYFWAAIGEQKYLMAYNKGRIPTYSSYSTPFQNGSQTQYEWTHHWANGVNPYDLAFPAGGGTVLDSRYPNVSLYASGGYPNGVWYDRPHSIVKYSTTLVGDKIYVLYSAAAPNSMYWGNAYSCDDNGDCYEYQTYLTKYDPPKLQIAQFDAVTGDLLDDGKSHPIPSSYNSTYQYSMIGSMPLYSYYANYYTYSARGNHLEIVYRDPSNGSLHSYAIISPDGAIVSSGSLQIPSFVQTFSYYYKNYYGQVVSSTPKTYSCQWVGPYGASGPYWDDEGNIIGYMQVKCYAPGSTSPEYMDNALNPDAPTGMWVVKFDLNAGTYIKSAKLAGSSPRYDSMQPYHFPMENDPVLVYNPFTKQAYMRSFNIYNPSWTTHYEVVMMDGSGAKWNGPEIANWINYWSNPFYQTPSGATGGGWCTYTASGTCESYNLHAGQRMWWKTGYFGADERKTTDKMYGQFVGDGLYMSMYSGNFLCSCGSAPSYDRWVFLDTGPVNTNEAYKGFRIGQFMSDTPLADAEINFTLTMRKPQQDRDLAGLSFRMSDPRNRYAVETDGSSLYLSRYVGGSRTVLQSTNWPAQPDTDYSFKVRATGSRIEVLVGGVPYFDVTDGTFPSGKFGPFSDKPGVGFKAMSSKIVQASSLEWLTNYAIWESGAARAEVRYDSLLYSDPEGDPRAGTYQWSITHSPKFMNHQGVSGMHGQMYTSERLEFDKVGEYWISLRARDDPHPNFRYPSMVFDSYRQNSNTFQQRLIVHRRPVAQFSLYVAGDGTIGWTDTSYDPDRWVSAGSFSAPDVTGIDYGATRGIMERKYSYISPSGTYVESKLTRPAETGTYTVSLAVRDEYGAWSTPYTQTVTVGFTPSPNTRPTASLTFPFGTQAAPNLIYTKRPTITWTQADTIGTIFKGFHVKITNESGQLVAESGESPQWTASGTASWTVPIDLPIGVKLQVQVKVSDGEEWSVWSNTGWMQVNSPPTVTLTYPSGSQTAPTIIQANRRPTIQFTQVDADAGTVFQGGDVLIQDASGNLVYSAGMNQNTTANLQSFTVTTDLPTGVPLQVKVRTTDGSAVSAWSNIGWMLINSRPSAAVTQPLGTYGNPGVGGLRPLIGFRLTDPEPGTVFSQFQVWIGREDGSEVLNVSQSGVFAGTDFSYQVGVNLPAGLKLQVRVRGWDQYGLESDWSPVQWFLTNRPPSPAFDWSPKPVWEGDVVTLLDQSSDPDGDSLTYSWEIRRPDGSVFFTSSAKQPSQQLLLPGAYSVKLTVSDAVESRSLTKTIQVEELTLLAAVRHTPQWLELHTERGHNTTVVPLDFYSGERFQLDSTTAAASVDRVTATLTTEGLDGNELTVTTELVRQGSTWTFAGELFDPRFLSVTAGLPEGVVPIHFEVRYANGVVKARDVPVNIIGNAQEIVTVHRQR
ncbi:PKD domain-containing protein [Paenibacillus sp. HJGM_3]|uniref:PKD domain-containing protein n=1 Tax=Paenibacillus sp. HJGM_3 TaxID=3379816 RepID=UPI00385C154B